MKNVFTIVSYTIKEAITKKAFIISSIIMFILIIIACNIPNILNTFTGNDTGKDIVLIDSDHVLPDTDTLAALGYNATLKDVSIDELKDEINNDSVYAGIVIYNRRKRTVI